MKIGNSLRTTGVLLLFPDQDSCKAANLKKMPYNCACLTIIFQPTDGFDKQSDTNVSGALNNKGLKTRITNHFHQTKQHMELNLEFKAVHQSYTNGFVMYVFIKPFETPTALEVMLLENIKHYVETEVVFNSVSTSWRYVFRSLPCCEVKMNPAVPNIGVHPNDWV